MKYTFIILIVCLIASLSNARRGHSIHLEGKIDEGSGSGTSSGSSGSGSSGSGSSGSSTVQGRQAQALAQALASNRHQ